MEKQGSAVGVALLVAGTCVGGGMLALPVITGPAGFIPSLFLMALACAFMAITGLLFVEANLWLGPGTHFTTMAAKLLGPVGKVVVILLYLFIGYLSLIAYTAGGGELFEGAIIHLFGAGWGKWVTCTLFIVVFTLIIALGHSRVGRVNELLFVAMILAYLFLIVGGIGEVKWHNLLHQDWTFGIYSVPLLLTIFSYQAVVPSLVIYLNGDGRRLRAAIIWGAIIAFFIYALWQWLVLGIVPLQGSHGLNHAFQEGFTATQSLSRHAAARALSAVSQFFAFFALATSFLGIALGLFDFLVDGLKAKRTGVSKWALLLLIAVPTLIPAVLYPRVFIEALGASGGFGDAVLNGMIPVLMVWSGRYRQQLTGSFRVKGGPAFLFVIFVTALFVLVVEILQRINVLVPINDLR
ncbi:MAG: amino acid permease [Parachlamydiales bacterium]